MDDDIDEACSKKGKYEMYTESSWEYLKERHHFEDNRANRRLMLKRI
jgi:hypothetical protein